jgi:hypothetical protein
MGYLIRIRLNRQRAVEVHQPRIAGVTARSSRCSAAATTTAMSAMLGEQSGGGKQQ